MKKLGIFFLSSVVGIVLAAIVISYLDAKPKQLEDKCKTYGEVTGRTVLYKNGTCFVNVNNLWYTQDEVGYLLIKPSIIKK